MIIIKFACDFEPFFEILGFDLFSFLGAGFGDFCQFQFAGIVDEDVLF